MKEQPKVSVIMPAYNCERYISAAIESVLEQSWENFELLVVDDCSRDGTAACVEKYTRRDSRVRLICCGKNQGVAMARNRGIDEAAGEYIAFLDSDDVWVREKLEKQLSIAEETGAEIVYGSYSFIDEAGKRIKRPFVVPEFTDFGRMINRNVIGNSTVLLKADLLAEHRFRSDVHHEDYVLWLELLEIPVKARGCRDVLMHYRQVGDARNRNKLQAARERWKIYRTVLDLSVLRSACAFVCYSVSGVLKYYVPWMRS